MVTGVERICLPQNAQSHGLVFCLLCCLFGGRGGGSFKGVALLEKLEGVHGTVSGNKGGLAFMTPLHSWEVTKITCGVATGY